MNPSTIAIPTLELATAGQSPWLDQISRRLIESGRLRELIEDYGLLGVTSNPSIFEKAIGAKDGGYEPDIRRMARAGKSPFEIYDALTVAEIRSACDLFAKVYQSSGGEHGFVSLEVMPSLSRDTAGTVREALRLAAAVGLPNVMIKVPATPEGVAAVRELIARGVHVNATLIFSAKQYLAVAKAYLDGLAAFAKKGGKPGKVRSVASAFVSRFDSLIDKKLDAMVAPAMDDRSRERIAGLAGKAAIANSKILFQEFKKIFHSEPFLSLAEKGAHPQKLLWGSTSTKNPAYPDLLYVEPLVGLGTVNTIPLETLEAFIDHGHVHAGSVEENVEEAYETAGCLKALGIDLAQTGELLQQQGVRAFSDSFDQLMKTIEVAREAALNTKGGRRKAVTVSVSHGAQRRASSVDAAARKMTKSGFLARFLAKEPALWKKDPEHQAVIRNRMGWLGVADWMRGQCYLLDLLKKDVLQGKIRDVVLFGMGGSSLAPEVMSLICRPAKKGVRFHLLDTTDPGTIAAVEAAIDLSHTLFLVASKSGSTIETLSQYRYFAAKVRKLHGSDVLKCGAHFAAITDPGSGLEAMARENRFRCVFLNPADIGGRYSALSFFGLVPAALMGIDFRRLLASALSVSEALRSQGRVASNTSLALGIWMAEWARSGANKLTFVMSRALAPFGAWLEQLIAESTGKEGKGVVPVDGETLGGAEVYGKDRAFVRMRLASESPKADDAKIRALKRAGFPVAEFVWPDAFALGGEFLRWEIATAVTSALLGINPFDEPNVKEAKDNTALILKQLAAKGKLTGLNQFRPVTSKTSAGLFCAKIRKGSYLSLLVYGPRTPEFVARFNRLRDRLRDALKVPVLVGFGPRYLHSIGQLYKGGPKQGAFIELLIQGKKDPSVPKAGYTFGQLIRAQALGDLKSLRDKKLPVLTLDLGKGEPEAFEALERQLGVEGSGRKKE